MSAPCSAARQPVRAACPAPPRFKQGGHGCVILIGVSPRSVAPSSTRSRTDLNCLIRGESGTGKDLVAREIHRLSARRERPLRQGELHGPSRTTPRKQLFGYEKKRSRGPVVETGAVRTRQQRHHLHGRDRRDVPTFRPKSCRSSNTRFTKLGGRKHIHVDVQIIAATNADLEAKPRRQLPPRPLFPPQ